MAWTIIPDSDIDPDSPVTTGLMTALRDNVAAAFAGDSGSPQLVEEAITPITTGSLYRTDEDTTEGSESGTIYAKVTDELIVLRSGTYQVSFDLKLTGTIISAQGKIYRNASTAYSGNVAFGTEQTTSSLTYITKTETLTLNAGDKLSVYAKRTGAATSAEVNNFRIESAIKLFG